MKTNTIKNNTIKLEMRIFKILKNNLNKLGDFQVFILIQSSQDKINENLTKHRFACKLPNDSGCLQLFLLFFLMGCAWRISDL